MNFSREDLEWFGYADHDEASYERACRLIVEEKVREVKAEEYAARVAKAEEYAARMAKAEEVAPKAPVLPRCPIILIADQKYRRGDRRHFSQRNNLAAWDGVRLSFQPECGGGRRIIRKAIADS